jgi:hypothetical protein
MCAAAGSGHWRSRTTAAAAIPTPIRQRLLSPVYDGDGNGVVDDPLVSTWATGPGANVALSAFAALPARKPYSAAARV